MSYWSLYFLAKVGMHYSGKIALQWSLNLLLLAFLVWPIASRRWQRARLALALPVAVVLFYRESYLPRPERVWSQLSALSSFSADYMLELVQRLVKPMEVAAAVAVLLLYSALAKHIRFSAIAVLAIVSVPLSVLMQPDAGGGTTAGMAPMIQPSAGSAGTAPVAVANDPDSQLKAFYAAESQRKLVLSAGGQTPPFDLLVLNICSLGWDDMDFVDMRNHPVMQRFDAVFTQFNTATSYSGPAMIRLMHGTCGQMPQKAMYGDLDPECYTFPSLEKIGYRTQGLLNHVGTFEGYGKSVEKFGSLAGKMFDSSKAPVHMQSFFGTPIYNDYALLSQWWKDRQTLGAQPVALFYNGISLHDGNLVPGLSSRNSIDTFKPRLVSFLSDLDKFLNDLEATGRPVVVMLVPEHGASLRGDKLQIPGMREIPGPRITLVPAAIKIIGGKPSAPQQGPVLVDQPMSFFGLFTLINDLMGNSPYAENARPMSARVQGLPTTQLVSENEDLVVMGNQAQGYQLRLGNGGWVPYGQ
jgi:cellulose synthase operon protein YhjU